MSTVENQTENAPTWLEFIERMGSRPHTLTATLLRRIAESRPFLPVPQPIHELIRRDDNRLVKEHLGRLKQAFSEFMKGKEELQRLVVNSARNRAHWDAHTQFLNMHCEFCTYDEAVADYLRSIPSVFRASIKSRLVSEDEMLVAELAVNDLKNSVSDIVKELAPYLLMAF